MPSAWISVTTYGQKHGVDRKTVHKWLAAGLLEFYRVERLIRVKDVPPRERRKTPRPSAEPRT
jgi:hypothetical protein